MTIPTAIHPRKPAMGGCSARVQRRISIERGLHTSATRQGQGQEGDQRQNERKVGSRTQDMRIFSQRTLFM